MGVVWDWSVREVLDRVGSEGEIWDWVEMGGEGWCGRVVWEVEVIGDGEEVLDGVGSEVEIWDWVEMGGEGWCGWVVWDVEVIGDREGTERGSRCEWVDRGVWWILGVGGLFWDSGGAEGE